MGAYETLGINEDATTDDIKKAYRKKAKKNHPDIGGDVGEFQQIVSAYELLTDDTARKFYDKNGYARQGTETDIDRKATQMLNDLLYQLLESVDNAEMIYIDVVAEMRKFIKQNQDKSAGVIACNEKLKKKLLKASTIFKKRLKHKKKTTQQNFFFIAINNKIEGINHSLQHLDQEARMMVRAQEIIGDFTFSFDTKEKSLFINISFASQGNTTSTSGF